MNNFIVKIETQSETGSGFVYIQSNISEFMFVITARHVLCGKNNEHAIDLLEITISNHNFEYKINSLSRILIGENNNTEDIAIIVIPLEEISVNVDNLNLCLIEQQNVECFIKGTSNATNCELFRTLTECKTLIDKDHVNQIQVECNDTLIDSNWNSADLVGGYSGSGIFVLSDSEPFAFGIVSSFDSNFKRFGCTDIRVANSILVKNGFQPMILQSIETNGDIIRDIKILREHRNITLDRIRDVIKEKHLSREKLRIAVSNLINESKNVLVSGVAGSGKSALIKNILSEFINDEIIAFKADELDRSTYSEILKSIGINSTFDTLLSSTGLLQRKIILIDSAEKILEAKHIDSIIDFIAVVNKRVDVKLILTLRSHAFQFLRMRLSPIITFSFFEIHGFENEELEEVAEIYPHIKPLIQNTSISNLLSNPFYLARTVEINNPQFGEEILTEKDLKQKLWTYLVKGIYYGADIPTQQKRSKVFSEIAINRAKAMTAFVPYSENSSIVEILKNENLIVTDNLNEHFAPAHDIFEDWALTKFINDCFNTWIIQPQDIDSFYLSIGNEPSIRRSFRLWIKEQIDNEDDRIKAFIGDTLISNVSQHWKDEILLAILQANSSYSFLSMNKNALFDNNKKIFNRYILLLRVACQQVDYDHFQLMTTLTKDVYPLNLFLKPIGQEWSIIINFINHNRECIDSNSNNIINLLLDWGKWINSNSYPPEAKQAGEILAYIINFQLNSDSELLRDKECIQLLYKLSGVVTNDVRDLFDWAIKYKKNRSDNYYKRHFRDLLFELALSWSDSRDVCHFLPEKVIEIAKLNWFAKVRPLISNNRFFDEDEDEQTESKEITSSVVVRSKIWTFIGEMYDVTKKIFIKNKTKQQQFSPIPVSSLFSIPRQRSLEEEFGITDDHEFKYFPSSAFQTPICHLLTYELNLASQLIVDLFNHSIDSLEESCRFPEDKITTVSIQISEKEVVYQKGNQTLWAIYRRSSHNPNLLESTLMALEKWMLEISELAVKDPSNTYLKEKLYSLFDFLIKNSKNVATTGVLASVVTAQPKFWAEKALILLKTREFVQWDLSRFSTEISVSSIWVKEHLWKERDASNKLQHRKESLENVATKLATIGYSKQIYEIIDRYRLNPENEFTWKLALDRMDFRLYKPIAQIDNQIIFQGEVQDELKSQTEAFRKDFETQGNILSNSQWARQSYENSEAKSTRSEWEDKFNAISESTDLLFNFPGTYAVIGIRDLWVELSEEHRTWCIETIFEIASLIIYKEQYQAFMQYNSFDVQPVLSILPQIILLDNINYKNRAKRLVFDILLAGQISEQDRKAFNSQFKVLLWDNEPKFVKTCIWNIVSFEKAEDKKSIYDKLILDEYEVSIDQIDISNLREISNVLAVIPSKTSDEDIYLLIDKVLDTIVQNIQREGSKYHTPRHILSFETEQDIAECIANYLFSQPFDRSKLILEKVLVGVFEKGHNSRYDNSRLDFANWIFSELMLLVSQYQDGKDTFWKLWACIYQFSENNNTQLFSDALLLQPEKFGKGRFENWDIILGKRDFIKSCIKLCKSPKETLILLTKVGFEELMPFGLQWLSEFDGFKIIEDEDSFHILEKLAQQLYYNPKKRQIVKQNQKIGGIFLQCLDMLIDRGSAISFIIRDDFISSHNM
jgi:hypothetical protein